MLPYLVTLFQIVSMPTVHIIDSIKIEVYSREHLPPHFHALYAEYEILIAIKTLETYAGEMPGKQYKATIEWAKLQKSQNFLLQTFIRLNSNLRS